MGTAHLLRREPAARGRRIIRLPRDAAERHRSSASRRGRRAATPPSWWPLGPRRIAQKVGEEGLELALASVAQSDAEVIGEAADLLYHLLLLLKVKQLSLAQVVEELEARHKGRTGPR